MSCNAKVDGTFVRFQYFSNGFLKNGVDDQPQLGQLAGPAGAPIAQDPPNRNQVQESETLPPDDSKVTYDPAETQSAFGALVGWVASWFDGEEETAVSGATLPAKPKSPQELLDERDALQAEIASLEASLGRALTWYEQELKKEQAKGLTTHQIEQSITMRQHREATRKSWDRLQEMKKKLQVVVVVLQTEHPQILNAEEQRKLQEAAYARLKDKKFSPQEFDALFEGASVFRDDGQLILKEGDIWTVFTFHPAQYANTMVFPPSGPFVSADYVKLVEPAYWQLRGRFPATLSFRSIQEMKGILEELGSKQQLQIVAEFALHVVPFGTLTDKIATGEGGDWDEVLLTTAGDALFVVSFGFGGTTAAARLAQARIAAGSVGVNLFGAGYETFKASTDEEGLTTARGANIFAGLLFAMLDAKEAKRLIVIREVGDAAKGASRNFPEIKGKDVVITEDSDLYRHLMSMELTEEAKQ